MRGGKEGQLPGAHQYQYVYNITVDNYAGYLCVPHNFSHGETVFYLLLTITIEDIAMALMALFSW